MCYMCFYFYNAVVCEANDMTTLSIKCTVKFVNTLNKIHFYAWSISILRVLKTGFCSILLKRVAIRSM